MKEEFFVGHDVGTQGAKSALVEAGGRLRATSFATYPVHYPQANWAEQEAQDWWKAVVFNTRRLLDSSGVRASQVAAMGFAGQMVGVVPVDAELADRIIRNGGNPIRHHLAGQPGGPASRTHDPAPGGEKSPYPRRRCLSIGKGRGGQNRLD